MPSTHGKANKGSQKWLQILVNECPELLNDALSSRLPDSPGVTDWRSPLARDKYKEHRDKELLEKLGGSRFLRNPLPTWPNLYNFWPKRGPSWDSHGVTDKGQLLLVEAKSHIREMRGSGSGATSQKSIAKIAQSLKGTQQYLGTNQSVNWAKSPYFQYANRLAHLYWFRELNGLPAFLLMVYFLNDAEQAGPSQTAQWDQAIADEKTALGIRSSHKLSDFVVPVFIDVNDIEAMV